jgi:hypothetical protein
MFAHTRFLAAAPLRLVNADVSSREYGDARASRALRARRIEPAICAPDAQKPNCPWGGQPERRRSRRSLDASRAPERAVCRGDEE